MQVPLLHGNHRGFRMAYRLPKDEPVSAGLKRVVTKQLESAAKQLADAGPTDDVIHEARKSIKKVRAVLQLFRRELGSRRDRKRLRRASRLLSPLRDADAMLAAAKALGDRRRGTLNAGTGAAISDVLNRHKVRLCRAAERDHAGRRAAKALTQIRRSAKGWSWKKVDIPVLAAAVRRSYRKARRAMETARDGGSATDFHEWRKRVKTLWYALRLLEERVPRRQLVADLDHVETWLGEDHNLLTFRTHVLGSRRVGKSAHAEIKTRSGSRQAALRRRALALGTRLFDPTPRAFIQRLHL
jgi:CHAD domain-containing protein